MSLLEGMDLEYLNSRFYYNYEEGILYKKAFNLTGLRGHSLGAYKSWNKANANMPSGAISKQGYVVSIVRVGKQKAWLSNHRVIYEIVNNIKLREDQHIDHLDGNRSNNKIENLRLCVNARVNAGNRTKESTAQSGLLGVSRDRNSWVVNVIAKSGGQKVIGFTKDLFVAACARKSWECKTKFGRDFANKDYLPELTDDFSYWIKYFIKPNHVNGVTTSKWQKGWLVQGKWCGVVTRIGAYEDWFEAVCARKSWELSRASS